MKKSTIVLIVIIIIAGLAVSYFSKKEGWVVNHPVADQPTHTVPIVDPKNGTYTIDNQSITLANGKAELETEPGSASKDIFAMFGEPVIGDINGDGVKDAVFILSEQTGGTATFFYAVASVSSGDSFVGTNGIILGDRIAPQNIRIDNAMIEVNYADRKAGEPMSEQPSLGVTKNVQFKGGILIEVK